VESTQEANLGDVVETPLVKGKGGNHTSREAVQVEKKKPDGKWSGTRSWGGTAQGEIGPISHD